MREIDRLVHRFGSPLYVYRLDRVRAAHQDLRSDLSAPSTLYYSLKANPHPLVVDCLRRLGCRAEISSTGELAAALTAGFAGAACMYTGPGKTVAEIRSAVAAGVVRFSVESLADYVRVADTAAEAGARAECLLRVNLPSAAGASGLRMGGAPTQFGIDLDEVAQRAGEFRDRPGAAVVGAHFFPVSNARSEESLVAEVLASIETAAQLRDEAGLRMSVVDLGSGFAAPYASPGRRARYPGLAGPVETALDRFLPGWRRGDVEVAFESGRYLVGDCGSLLSTVTDVKYGKGHRFAVLDAGINHLGGLSGLGRLLPVNAVTSAAVTEPVRQRTALVGPLCTPADVLARNADVGELGPGQVIEVPNTGAYGLTASLVGFLGRPTPVEVILDGDGVIDVSRLELARRPMPA